MSYDGAEQRKDLPSHILLECSRQDLELQEQRIVKRLEALERNQAVIEKKIDRWEAVGTVLRWAVIAGVGIITALESMFEWARQHLR